MQIACCSSSPSNLLQQKQELKTTNHSSIWSLTQRIISKRHFSMIMTMLLSLLSCSLLFVAARLERSWTPLLLLRPFTAVKTRHLAAVVLQERLQEASPESPILVMGLPRSGSLAIHEFFTCKGYSSAHYCCTTTTTNDSKAPNKNDQTTHFPCSNTCASTLHDNLIHDRAPFYDLSYSVYSQFDAETSDPFAWFLPQHFSLPLLSKSYPNAVWILNERSSPQVWAADIAHRYSMTVRMLTCFGWDYHSTSTKAQHMLIAPPSSRAFSRHKVQRALEKSIQRAWNITLHEKRLALLEQIYQNHSSRIEKFAAKYNHELVRINVDEHLAIDDLCWKFDSVKYDNEWRELDLKM